MTKRTGLAAATAVIAAATAIGGTAQADPTPAPKSTAEISKRALKLADKHEAAIHAGAGQDLRATGVYVDAAGASHTRMSRTYRGLPVVGGEVVVHQTKQGKFAGVSQTLKSEPQVSTTPKVSASSAQRAAVQAGYTRRGEARLVVDARGGHSRLAWQVVTVGKTADGTPSRLVNTVDAGSGRVLRRSEQITTFVPRDVAAKARNRSSNGQTALPGLPGTAYKGTGSSLYSGTVSLSTRKMDGKYRLTDLSRGGFATYNMNGSGEFESKGKPFIDSNNKWGNGKASHSQTAAVDVHYGTQVTWDYYKKTHLRNGNYDNGLGMLSRVHFGENGHGYDNAFFDPAMDAFAFGDGHQLFNPLVRVDVVAHENTHAVTYATANLDYEGESGGLNESTSDILGTMGEFYANNSKDKGDYLIGENIWRPGNPAGRTGALRYMDKPSRDGRSHDCWKPDVGQDNVHRSSGVGNHFFYLLSEGSGQKEINGVKYDSPTCDGSTVKGVGNKYAAKIWYQALRAYMTFDTDYHGAREATLHAAKTLYGEGTAIYKAVEAAWSAVNVKPAS